MKKLSVAIAVFNEERYLKQCLESIKDIADELVIVDGGSTDNTLEIAQSYGAFIVRTDNPAIFHINKQKALDKCTGEWILQLDADEVITSELKNEILETIHDKTKKENGYFIPRKNIFWGHVMKKTGVYPDYVIRLIKNGKGKFPCESVHEQIDMQGLVGYLDEPMLHYSYETLGDYWRKANAYTSLTADDLLKKKVTLSFSSAISYNIVYPVKTFFTLFFRNKGFMDSTYGFLFSFFSALHHPIAYWKFVSRLQNPSSK